MTDITTIDIVQELFRRLNIANRKRRNALARNDEQSYEIHKHECWALMDVLEALDIDPLYDKKTKEYYYKENSKAYGNVKELQEDGASATEVTQRYMDCYLSTDSDDLREKVKKTIVYFMRG